MATVGPKKLSFARVAASGAKETMAPTPAQRVAVPTPMENRRMSPTGNATTGKNGTPTSAKAVSPTVIAKSPPVQNTTRKEEPSGQKQMSSESGDAGLAQGVKDLKLSSTPSAQSTPSLVVNGSSSSVGELQTKNEGGQGFSDDVSQRADSSSEIGTKAPSLDGKSITSGTTFGLDEKESLRPDDSASVKAAADDDEAFSIRGSQMANSRMGSDIARVHRLRIGDMPERRIIQLLPETQDQCIATPQSNSSSVPTPAEKQPILAPVSQNPDAFNSMYAQNPDEKLIDAMSSPKDRIFLLRLEQDVINFVQTSKDPYMDLPPNNSFCRMLTHKLADYYHMTHSFEAVQGAVRIYRTPFCRVPPSLASIVGTTTESNTNSTPPVVLPKKIMRRGEEVSGNASNSPSKATSEVGSDGKEKSTKEKLTREQREEAYNRARERIFGNTEKTGDSTPDNDDANGMSRASSVSGKEKSSLGRRGKTGKQRRDDSESFDSRSQYTPYYGPNPHQPSWAHQYIQVGSMPYNGQAPQPYPTAMPQVYPQSGPAYQQMMPQGQMNGYPPYAPMPPYAAQAPQPATQRYPAANGAMPGYSSPMQAAPPQPAWQPQPQPQSQPPPPPPPQQQQQQPPPPVYQQAPSPAPGPYPQPARGSQTQSNVGPMGIPYAFGQLPANVNPNDPKSQHPIPGSYNRHAFNPKTQSFVPSNGMNPGQSPMTGYAMTAPHGSPQIGSPHLGYNGFSSPVPQSYMGGPPSYGMSRQSSNNSLPAYHPHATPPQHMQPHPGPHYPQMPQQMGNQMPQQMGNQMPQQMSNQMPQQMGQYMQHKGSPAAQPMGSGGHQPAYSNLPNYGNPATLPQKPPTGTS